MAPNESPHSYSLGMLRGSHILWLALLSSPAPGATGGPDGGGLYFADSTESDGPPVPWLDLSAGTSHSLGDDELESIDLPFTVDWYGIAYDQAWISSNGALFFGGATASDTGTCPGSGDSWAGIAGFWDDLHGSIISSETFGQYPYRVMAVEWADAQHPGARGLGNFQVQVLERSSEAVIVLDDVTFGSSAVDGGVGAVIGTQGASGDGLAWSCAGGLSDGTAAWYYGDGDRPATTTIPTLELHTSWNGEGNWSYAGRTLATGDINADGLSDLVVGNQDLDTGLAWLLYGPTSSGLLSDVASSMSGEVLGDQAGAALAVGDLDGDGFDDVVVGAPQHDGAGTNAGAVYTLYGPDLSGFLALGSDADWIADGPGGLGQGQLGSAVAIPGDVDGDGLADLLVSAPNDDPSATNAGTVFLFEGAVVAAGGRVDTASAVASFEGTHTTEALGSSLAGADLDGDGLAELVLGSPEADTAGTNTGAVYIVPGGAWSGSHSVTSVATSTLLGEDIYDEAGTDLLLMDIDGTGGLDLVIGAPGSDTGGTEAGKAYLLYDPSISLGTFDLAGSDTTILGNSAYGHVGTAITGGDLNSDGQVDLLIASPNETISGITAGGVTYVFTTPPAAGFVDSADADHQIHGSLASSNAGVDIAFMEDWNGDGYGDIALSAPLASTDVYSGNGMVYVWSWFPSFADADGDGFVSIRAQAMDCDDDDAAAYPGAPELYADLVDNDCDGWVDDLFRPRWTESYWTWDLENEWGDPAIATFDFEGITHGTDVTELYAGYGLHFIAPGRLLASDEVEGSLPRDTMGAAVWASGSNAVELSFDEPVDGVALWLLDPTGDFEIVASSGGVSLFSGWFQTFSADNLRGGTFLSLELAESIDSLELTCVDSDGWGIDDVQVVWASLTDADGDGFTEADGDCDDTDPAVGPHASEIWANGVDDDCDGVVDSGGATVYDSETDWRSDAGLDEALVDFEDHVLGTIDAAAYQDLGLTLPGGPSVATDIDGAAPRDSQAALVATVTTEDSVVLQFQENQPALSLWLVDPGTDFDYAASHDGTVLYAGTVPMSADDVAGGSFLGFVFDVAIDELELTAGSYSDSFGIDDIVFSTLGLDDADGDGYTERTGDCDDGDDAVSPDAEETWYDGVDSDCDGGSDYDSDLDGFDSSIDCDDTDASVNPDAEETWYDGVDSDCDGWSDYDSDLDGHDFDRDCDDEDDEVNPDAEETYYDDVDSNCDPSDEYDADGDGYSVTGASISGTVGSGDCDDGDASVSPGASETWYDGIDQDCDETSDYDADLDGYDSDLHGGSDCDDADPTISPAASSDSCYDGIDQDCDGVSDYDCDEDGWIHDAYTSGEGDCDDSDASVNPDAPEIVGDGIDQNCDGFSDYDADLDGFEGVDYGGDDCDDDDPTVSPDGVERCGDGADTNCDGYDDYDCDADGFADAIQGGADCDDTDASIQPDAIDTCYDGIDADCAGDSDDDCDADGYDASSTGGTDCDDTDSTIRPGATDYPYDGIDQDCDGADDYDLDGDGYTVDFYGGADCDDGDASVYPGAPDYCYDGTDSDCDGSSEYDCDRDGHDGSLFGGDDCDDSNPGANPSAEEICGDGVDQNCDGSDVCLDADGDGFADVVHGGTDCDDDDDAVFPGALDICYDGTDSDCSGGSDFDCDRDGYEALDHGGTDCDDADDSISPGVGEVWYDGVDQNCDDADDYDQDGDGHQPTTWGGGDCDDADPDRHPDVATDGCGGDDEDCDGEVDEDCHPETDTGDTAPPDDSDEPDDTDPPSDTAETGTPADTGATHVDDTGADSGDSTPWTPTDDTGGDGEGEGCDGCSAAPSPPVTLLWPLLLGLTALRSRRRR